METRLHASQKYFFPQNTINQQPGSILHHFGQLQPVPTIS